MGDDYIVEKSNEDFQDLIKGVSCRIRAAIDDETTSGARSIDRIITDKISVS